MQKDTRFKDAELRWNKVDALMGGTETMRLAGTAYLPKFSKEKDELYAMRLQTSTLFNAYKQSITTNVGRITSRQVQIESNALLLNEFVKDVDTTGRSLTEFSKDLLTNSFNHGVSFILVDFPQTQKSVTLEEIKNFRPYFVDISAQQVLSVKSDRINGKEELVYFKYSTQAKTTFSDWDEELETEVEQVREYMLKDGIVSYRIKQKVSGSWVVVDSGVMSGLTRLPIIPLYANRSGFFLGEPLLEDLADLNIRHWQSSSDQQWILHFSRTPILFAKGFDSRDENGVQQELNVGPNSVVSSDRTDADLSYVEVSGAAINAGRQDLQDLEDQMTVLGLDVAVDKSGAMTATSRAINAAATDSVLRSIALQLEDVLTQALFLVQVYYSSAEPYTVDVNKEYIPVFESNEMREIWEMYRNNMITAGDVLKEAKRRNVLTPKFQISQELNERMITQGNDNNE